MIQRALISVSDKTGIEKLAKNLNNAGVEIISTGGTAKAIAKAGVPVVSTSDVTQFPEILDGRVKTLHPAIHGAILGQRNVPKHVKTMKEHNIKPIDLVVVNLYPFQKTVAKPGVTTEEAIENIDIGGVALIRAAAKNYKDVVIVTNPERYNQVSDAISKTREVPIKLKEELAVEAFEHTAEYDSAIWTDLSKRLQNKNVQMLHYIDGRKLRYGENPHQTPAFTYAQKGFTGPSVATARLLHGEREVSYNNILDAEGALALAVDARKYIPGYCVFIIKHGNACGAASAPTLAQAFSEAWKGDPISRFGSINSFSHEVDLETAKKQNNKFIEVNVAEAYTKEALDWYKNNPKKNNLRILQTEPFTRERSDRISKRAIVGGLLTQPIHDTIYGRNEDGSPRTFKDLKNASGIKPAASPIAFDFAYLLAKHTMSNCHVVVQEYKPGYCRLVGSGPGQQNRVESLRVLAAPRAMDFFEREYFRMNRDEKRGDPKARTQARTYARKKMSSCVAATDSFYPFTDGPNEAFNCGICNIINAGGALKDEEVIEAARQNNTTLIFTDLSKSRIFKH